MIEHRRKAWPVCLCLPVSFFLGYAAWFIAVITSEIAWEMNGRDGVWMTFFGNPRVSVFGGYAHWVPMIVSGAALAIPWLLLVFPFGRRAKIPSEKSH
jgi:hypothetical protein